MKYFKISLLVLLMSALGFSSCTKNEVPTELSATSQARVWLLFKSIKVDIEFGMKFPMWGDDGEWHTSDCALIGLCSLHVEILGSNPDAKGTLGKKQDGSLALEVNKLALDSNQAALNFLNGYFSMPEPLQLSDDICSSLDLPVGTIIPSGNYTYIEDSDTYFISF